MQLQNRLVPAAAVKQMTAKIEGLEDDLHRIVQVGVVGVVACSAGCLHPVHAPLAWQLGRGHSDLGNLCGLHHNWFRDL